MRTEEAELASTTAFLRRTLSIVGVRAQSKLLFRADRADRVDRVDRVDRADIWQI